MILSVDFNPVIRKRIKIPYRRGHVGTVQPERLDVFPGGEGIELSLMLGVMNEESIGMGFAGSYNGMAIRDFLNDSGIINEFVNIKEPTGEQLFINYSDDQELISEISPRVSKEEISEFINAFKENLQSSEMVCISGTAPKNFPGEVYEEIISIAKENGQKVLAGMKGHNAHHIANEKPYLLTLDVNTLENMTHLKLEYDSEIFRATRYLRDKGIKYIVVEMGSKGAIVITDEKGYRIELPHLNSGYCNINYGYMLAGFSTGILRGYDDETMLRLGIASSVIHCIRRSGEVDMSDIKSLMNKLEIRVLHDV
ncbi:MAG: PfkB family carbohydrate kinase [Gudongella sp.]|jgi:fructose-1-phosphate kinase PfkB-like protein|nr:PfkB family carbohydrate kinase [Gudongella sp.]